MRVPAVLPCVHHTESMEKLLEDTVSLFFFSLSINKFCTGRNSTEPQPSKLQFRICLAGASQPKWGQCPRISSALPAQPRPWTGSTPWSVCWHLPCCSSGTGWALPLCCSCPSQLFQIFRTVVWITSCASLPSTHHPCFRDLPVSSAAFRQGFGDAELQQNSSFVLSSSWCKLCCLTTHSWSCAKAAVLVSSGLMRNWEMEHFSWGLCAFQMGLVHHPAHSLLWHAVTAEPL